MTPEELLKIDIDDFASALLGGLSDRDTSVEIERFTEQATGYIRTLSAQLAAQDAARGEIADGCTHCGSRVVVGDGTPDDPAFCDGCCMPWEPARYQRILAPPSQTMTWTDCNHEWEVPARDFDCPDGFEEVVCVKCECPGQRTTATGVVFWPAS